ncbi:MAG: glycosyl hydrolase 115 family protein [Spirochaetaceae bacterium]|nr:glycosyl hydrolase 115 family protein [Spirochaetaceae bacterium]
MKINSNVSFLIEDSAFPGVLKIADKVCTDIERVTGKAPAKINNVQDAKDGLIIFGTVGKSPMLDQLAADGKILLDSVKAKNEVYSFTVDSNMLIIAGSDKRGTIYGLFHISELLGVSPLVDWADVLPEHKDEVELTEKDNLISPEPSVRYRGFFINDEWPAFGNWATTRFGGVNAKMYEHVFELLLRMKGNYLWPAMWASRFSDDGLGLANAELADELGVIMGASHHEPCCRAGEEYRYLRGKDSVYGDAWNFRTNPEGITRFWEDGLKRNGKFENVITVGMRGEADTAIMQNATLKDNIDLLRDVLKTQNSLIRQYVNEDISKVPRMLALYKEVEPYFYGDKKTKGLINSEELEGVTLMLCDDNHGNLRTLPTKKMRKHKGGYGMYYHFDYHGWPFSYEWFNTSHLAKIKEQMTAAYDFGIRELWIVNVGDIMTNEFPLNFFLDLAYDYKKYSKLEYTAEKYTAEWVAFNFPTASAEQKADICRIINGYTKLAHRRRTESLKSSTYHAVNFGESDETLDAAETIIEKCKALKTELPASAQNCFFAQVYVPALGNMNVLKMQLLCGKNQWLAEHGAMAANNYIEPIKQCLEEDKKLVAEIDAYNGGKWHAMGWSEHFGFSGWNEEENRYPLYVTTDGARKKRLIVWVDGDGTVTSGLPWSKKTLKIDAFKNLDCSKIFINIACGSKEDTAYKFFDYADWLKIDEPEGTVKSDEVKKIAVEIDRELLAKAETKHTVLKLTGADNSAGKVEICINVNAELLNADAEEGTFIQTTDYISIESSSFFEAHDGISKDGEVAGFELLEDYGKMKDGMKVYPVTSYFSENLKKSPSLTYKFALETEGIYRFDFYINPSNPATKDNYFKFGAGVNGKKVLIDVVEPDFAVGDHQQPWGTDVTNNIRVKSAWFDCAKGDNTLKVYAVTPNLALEKIVIYPNEYKMPQSYLGPKETYRK